MVGRRPPRTETLRSSEHAVSDVLGELLVIAILVGLFAVASISFLPGDPPTALHAEVATRLDCGGAGWGTGDEQVLLEHVGGTPVEQERTRIRVLVEDAETDHAMGTLDGPFADGALTIGERWSDTLSVPAAANVTVQVYYLHDDGAVALWHDAPVKARTCGSA